MTLAAWSRYGSSTNPGNVRTVRHPASSIFLHRPRLSALDQPWTLGCVASAEVVIFVVVLFGKLTHH